MDNQPTSTNSTPQPSYTPYLQPIPGTATAQPAATSTATGQPIPTANLPEPPRRSSPLIFIILTIIAGLAAIVFAGLFIWMWLQWDDVRSNVQGQIDSAVATAVSENTTALGIECSNQEKHPYNRFSTLEDYGSLEFEYPKTWSVYVSSDASDGGSFSAILNPDRVVAGESIYALQVSIANGSYESTINDYTKLVNSGSVMQSTQAINGETVNVYRGAIPGVPKGGYGAIVIIKIRDKVATLRTNAQAYEVDFDQIINTIKYNP